MPTAGIKPAILESERPQTHPVDRVVTWKTNRPVTSNYHFKQYIGVCVCVCVSERLCVGAHGGISMHNSLRKILSFIARPRVMSSPNHSNGATI